MITFKRLDWNTEINKMPFEKARFFAWASTHEKVFLNNKLIGYYIIEAPAEYSVTASKTYVLPRARYFIPLDVDYKYWFTNLKKYKINLSDFLKPKKIYIKEKILKMYQG